MKMTRHTFKTIKPSGPKIVVTQTIMFSKTPEDLEEDE